jgi:hypothetical protein
MMRPVSLAGLLCLLACAAAWAQQTVGFDIGSFANRAPGVTLSDFAGAVYLPAPELSREMGIGWTRYDFSWGAIEPKKERWEWANTDRLVLESHARGIEILPVLDYTAPWAASKQGDAFSPPQRTQDWEAFVEHVVARYSRAPFNLRYFQVWNEPTWTPMTFWHASGEEWVDRIFLPAAEIMRRYDCRVVFGGWPVADAANLFRVLDYHGAARWTDIVDIHYFENSVWQQIHDRYVKPGTCRGIWQTEIGFHSFPNYLPNCYLRALHWALRHGWTEPSQYKLFWFASWGAGDDGPKCLTQTGPDGKAILSEHGKRLAVMNQVLGGETLSVFSGFAARPDLAPELREQAPTVLGFKVGDKRVVVGLLFDSATYEKNPSAALAIRPPFEARRAYMITATGERQELSLRPRDPGQRTHSGVGTRDGGYGRGYAVRVPMRRVPLEVARGWGGEWRVAIAYVVIE